MGNVFVLVIKEKIGFSADVFSNYDKAANAGAEYCIDNWEFEESYDFMDSEEIIEFYNTHDTDTEIYIVERNIDTDTRSYVD